MRKLHFVSIWSTIAFMISCNLSEKVECGLVVLSNKNQYPIYISSFFSYYPVNYQGITHIDSIDIKISNKKFNNIEPVHDYMFGNCDVAINQAKEDFKKGRPSLMQFNGIMGESPYKNDVYSQVLGVYIYNTGCYIYNYSDCYNDEIWRLLKIRFGVEIQNFLDNIELNHQRMVIDSDLSEAIIVDEMPTIDSANINTLLFSGLDTLKCHYEYILLGRFTAEISKKGSANVIEYTEGSLDCICQNNFINFFESLRWSPAVLKGDSINSTINFQFIN